MNVPPVVLIRQIDTHRLIPSRYSREAESALSEIAETSRHLQDLLDLVRATDEEQLAENDQLPGISSHELVFGVKHNGIINGVFTHAHPQGSRFNGPDRGAWYAGFALETAQAEVIFHKTREYAEINWFDDSISYDDYLADFSGEFHDIRHSAKFRNLLNPNSYVASQRLAEQLLSTASLGIIYPSVRHSGGTCIVGFRAPVVGNVRRHNRYSFTWAGAADPQVTLTSHN
jgi:RES domain